MNFGNIKNAVSAAAGKLSGGSLDLESAAKSLAANATNTVKSAVTSKIGALAPGAAGQAKGLLSALNGTLPNGILQSLPEHAKGLLGKTGLSLPTSLPDANERRRLIEQLRGKLDTMARSGDVDLSSLQSLLDKNQKVAGAVGKAKGLLSGAGGGLAGKAKGVLGGFGKGGLGKLF